jgi:hypothetical protein
METDEMKKQWQQLTMWVTYYHSTQEGWDLADANRLQILEQHYTQESLPFAQD